jgi:signal transduction histidine kinase
MNLGLIEKNIETNIEKALAYLAESKDLARECLQHIRLVSYSLHPPLLDELGMNAALKWFIEGFSKRSSIDVTLEVKEDLGRLDTLVEITLFRIVQEALTNVHRHSGSKTATVRLWRNDTEITLSISDRGRGIEAGNSRTGGAGAGVGLASIRQQLSLVDGVLAILPGPGTTLVATIPYKSKTRDN